MENITHPTFAHRCTPLLEMLPQFIYFCIIHYFNIIYTRSLVKYNSIIRFLLIAFCQYGLHSSCTSLNNITDATFYHRSMYATARNYGSNYYNTLWLYCLYTLFSDMQWFTMFPTHLVYNERPSSLKDNIWYELQTRGH